MNRSIDEIYNPDKPVNLIICEETRDNTTLEARTEANRNWLEIYDNINLGDKLEYLNYMMRFQFRYISEQMENLEPSISFPAVGTFYYKESRKLYKDLIAEYPDKPIDEIVDIVKANHLERDLKKRNKVEQLILKNIQLDVAVPK